MFLPWLQSSVSETQVATNWKHNTYTTSRFHIYCKFQIVDILIRPVMWQCPLSHNNRTFLIVIFAREKLAASACDAKNLPYMDINWRSIPIYGYFVTSLTAYYSCEDISTYCGRWIMNPNVSVWVRINISGLWASFTFKKSEFKDLS